jgi:hypothetical protein
MADLWELADLCTPWCLHIVTTLRVAEHIEAGTTTIAEIAHAAACDPWTLHRILQHLVNKGVFEEPQEGRFALNDTARGLLDPMIRLGLNLDGFGGRMAHAWSTMMKYVRTGEPAYRDVFCRSFWDDLDAHPEIAAEFDALIGSPGHGTPDPNFDIAGGWESIRWVVDVGGGTGAMLAEILRTRPHVRGTLLDLPRTVAGSRNILEAAGVNDRISLAGQRFFDRLPAGADLYLLRGVLNDWGDAETVKILRRCAEAAGKMGRVVVLKSVAPDGARRPLTIEMILAGGKHRSLSEFREVAETAGLVLVSAQKQKSYFVVECRPI